MLKVIGASMQKTRIGTYILICAGLLVIGGFFIGYVDRPKYDGTYCATAFWSKHGSFQIEYWKQQNDLVNIPEGAARICYKDSFLDDSWGHIEIETKRTFPDSVQAFGAGLLEGSLTWDFIYNQWLNGIQNSCERDANTKNYCEWLRDLATKNYKELKKYAIHRAEHDHFWHQISLYFNQLEGLEAGYIRGAKRARFEQEIPFSDFLLMNSVPEIIELNSYFDKYVSGKNESVIGVSYDNPQKAFNWPKASMLIKIFKDQGSWQLLFGHCTLENYSNVKRIQKRYKFHYHYTPSQRSNMVPGVDITFSGIAGILASTDDFYIIKGHLMQSIVAGVKLKIGTSNTLQNITMKPLVPLFARMMAANRISHNRRMWAKTLTQHPYITYKQWITVDLHKLAMINNLHSKEKVPVMPEYSDKYRDIVWIVEQLPSDSKRKDVTDHFFQHNASLWITEGLPYFNEIINTSRIIRNNFTLTPSDDIELSSLKSVDKFLRLHSFYDNNIDGHTHFDIKLFSYNAKVGVNGHGSFVGPQFLRYPHVLIIENRDVENNKTKNDVLTNIIKEGNITLKQTDVKKRSVEYAFHKSAIRNK